MATVYFEAHPRMQIAIRRVVLKLDRGETLGPNDDAGPAMEFGYAVLDAHIAPEGEAPGDYFLTEKGAEAALRWRADDSHGGNAV
jgi:hypothetical protein